MIRIYATIRRKIKRRRKVTGLTNFVVSNLFYIFYLLDDGTWCELCEIFLPIPVTYHMRIVHPGCGKPAKGNRIGIVFSFLYVRLFLLGKGYNSVGTFCEGWAGNCGEGGKGASSWYLMCDRCREK